MAGCRSCTNQRNGVLQAIKRGKVITAAAIASKGARQVAASIKAPSVTAAFRKR